MIRGEITADSNFFSDIEEDQPICTVEFNEKPAVGELIWLGSTDHAMLRERGYPTSFTVTEIAHHVASFWSWNSHRDVARCPHTIVVLVRPTDPDWNKKARP